MFNKERGKKTYDYDGDKNKKKELKKKEKKLYIYIYIYIYKLSEVIEEFLRTSFKIRSTIAQ